MCPVNLQEGNCTASPETNVNEIFAAFCTTRNLSVCYLTGCDYGFASRIVLCAVIAIAALLVCVGVVVWQVTKEDDVSRAKNILFITVDDLRPELGFYHTLSEGYTPISPGIKTPNMDTLAGHSLVFTNAYTQYPKCCPSRASFMTSRRPESTRVWDLETYWRESGGNFTTIPQFFKEAGYMTVGMGKVYHGKACSGNDDPISWSSDYRYYHGPNRSLYGEKNNSWWAVSEEQQEASPLPDQDMNQHAISVLNEVNNDKDKQPFFMAVGYNKPHLPFAFPDKYLDDYPEEGGCFSS